MYFCWATKRKKNLKNTKGQVATTFNTPPFLGSNNKSESNHANLKIAQTET